MSVKRMYFSIVCIAVIILMAMLSFFMCGFAIKKPINATAAKEMTMLDSKMSEVGLMTKAEPSQLLNNESIENEDFVLQELNKQVLYYEKMLEDNQNTYKTHQIERLLTRTKNLMVDYNESKNPKTRGKFHVIYSAQVAILVAWFNSKNYKLSAELLTHASDNENLDSYYSPLEVNGIYSSPTFKSISEGRNTSGSSSFANTGTEEMQDLYYAIHKFSYSKSTSNTKVVTISDRYDFAPSDDYSKVAGLAVNAMVDAQDNGTVVPFKINMQLTPTTEVSVKTSSLQLINLGPGESARFLITFPSLNKYATIKTTLGLNISLKAASFFPFPKIVAEDKGAEGRVSEIGFNTNALFPTYLITVKSNTPNSCIAVIKITI